MSSTFFTEDVSILFCFMNKYLKGIECFLELCIDILPFDMKDFFFICSILNNTEIYFRSDKMA